jgi:hypothetical protein
MLELLDLDVLGFDGRLRRLQFGSLVLHDLSHLPQHFLQENRVCRKAIEVEPHARNDNGIGQKSHRKAQFS